MNYSADVDAAHDTQLSRSDELQIQSLARHYIRMLSREAGGHAVRGESYEKPSSQRHCNPSHERNFNLPANRTQWSHGVKVANRHARQPSRTV